MLVGGVLLILAAAMFGEFRGFHAQDVSARAWLALLYLIVAGSILAFTAYVWLIHHESPTKVGTYAYVNPVVAVFLGWLVLHEKVDRFILAGSAIVVVSVILVTSAKVKEKIVAEQLPAVEAAGD